MSDVWDYWNVDSSFSSGGVIKLSDAVKISSSREEEIPTFSRI
jgi:hypothetical protein